MGLTSEIMSTVIVSCQIFIVIMHIKFIIIGDVWSEHNFLQFYTFNLDYDLDLDVQ